MAQHQLGANTVVEENTSGEAVVKNTLTGTEVRLADFVDLVGSVNIDSDDTADFGDGNEWSLRYESDDTAFVLRDETTNEDIISANDGASELEVARSLGTEASPIPETSRFEALEAESANIAGFGVGRVTEEIFFDQDISSVPQLSIDWGKYDEIIIALQARGAASTVPVIADFDGVQADGWDITQRDQVGTFTRTEDTDLELHSDIRNIGAGIWRIVDTQGRYLAYGNGTSFGDARWMVNASATDDSPPSNDTLDLSDTTYDRVGVWGVE